MVRRERPLTPTLSGDEGIVGAGTARESSNKRDRASLVQYAG